MKASHINWLKSIGTGRKMAEMYLRYMLWISSEKSYFMFLLLLSNALPLDISNKKNSEWCLAKQISCNICKPYWSLDL